MTDTAKSKASKKELEKRGFGEWDTARIEYEPVEEEAPEKHVLILGSSKDDWIDKELLEQFYKAFSEHHGRLHQPHAASDPALDPEVVKLREEVANIRTRLERVEVVLEGVDEPSSVDPDMAWLEAHINVLKEHPDSYVAIDRNTGKVVVGAKSQVEFIEQLGKLDKALRKTLLRIHTALFLPASG